MFKVTGVLRPSVYGSRKLRSFRSALSLHFSSTSNNTSKATQPKGPSSSVVEVNNERSPAEIKALVQKRVQERDGWKVDGAIPGPHSALEVLGFMRQHLPDIMSFKPPSQPWLDEHFPVLDMDWETIQKPESMQITWLGHSSLLVQMDGLNILTDPVFSEKCSPSQWFGPQRYRPPPCSIEKLCERLQNSDSGDLIVLISHNHYDHLDYATVQTICQQYASKKVRFVVPLGIREWFRNHVCQDVAIYEMDWHEGIEYPFTTTPPAGVDPVEHSLRIECVPMRHWSNRIGDRDQTLWCGYSLTTSVSGGASDSSTAVKKFLFPGDTAWFDDLADLGQHYGPWDVAALPIGAYEPREFMKTNHIDVAEAIRMKDALDAKAAVPIHWGTFPVTIEPVMEPRERLVEGMKERPDADSFVPWHIGETKVF